MFDDLIRKYKKEKEIDSLEQAKSAVRGEDGAAMQITPGPAMGWADDPEDDRTGVEMPDEKYANAVDSEKRESRQTERQLLTDAKRK
jgi:hypothetical protein